MKRTTVARMILLVMLLAMTLVALSGCGGDKDKPATASNENTGRYVEEKLDLDKGFAQVLNSFREETNLVFYAQDGLYGGRVSRNVYIDGETKTEYPMLLNELAADSKNIWSISESPDSGIMVLHYDAAYNFTLTRVTDDAITQITVPDWAYNLYSTGATFPNKVIAIDDSFVVLFSQSNIVQYDYTGVVLHEYAVKTGSTGLAVFDGTLAALDINDNELVLFDLTTGRQTFTIPVSEILTSGGTAASGYRGSGDLLLAFDETGLILAFEDGVFAYNNDNGGFEKILDGELTSLVMPTVAINSVVNIGDDFYVFLDNSSEPEFVRYTYRDDMPKAPSVTLEIFSLYDNLTVRQAIGEFQRKNPEVKVNLRIGMDGSFGVTAEDIVRALNTEILAGKGPDLIVLDGLPIASYVEKEVLKDISALVDKLAANGFMENLENTYAFADGGIYGVPTRFTVPVMIGKAANLADINSLDQLAQLVVERQSGDNMFLFPPRNLYFDMFTLESSNILMNYYDVNTKRFVNTNGYVNEEELAAYFENMLLIEQTLKEYTPMAVELMMTQSLVRTASGIGAEYVDKSIDYMADEKAEISLMTLMGPQSLRYIIQALHYTDACIVPMFNGSAYFPIGGIGVLGTSGQQEFAESFIETLLSVTVQSQLLGDGFPVNERSLEYVLYELIKYWMEYVEATELLDMGFIQLAKNLNEPIFVDSVIKNAVENQIKALEDGLLTPQEAAQRVTNATRLYLAE